MQQSFWLERWQNNQTGFHDNDINPHLKQNWSSLALPHSRQSNQIKTKFVIIVTILRY
jgi:thiopurine S-methyltransferase